MLTVGDPFPAFVLPAVASLEAGREFVDIAPTSYPGKWLVVFFWPMDFTFVCPTELIAFDRMEPEFHARGAQLLGASTDTHYVHLAWRQSHPELRVLRVPMLADYKRELSTQLGIIHHQAGVALRATFIVDPERVIRWVNANDLSVGRSVEETLRVLDALLTGGLTPCDWRPGERTIDV